MSFGPSGNIQDLSLVELLFYKVGSLLPIESGLPFSEVEANTVFLNSRSALLNISQSSSLFDDVLRYAADLLEKLNKRDNHVLLKQRSDQSLSSVLIVLRLLADLTKVHWDAREPTKRKQSVDSNSSIASSNLNFEVGMATARVDHHTVPPAALDTQIASKAIGLASKLKSTHSIVQELAVINGKSTTKTPSTVMNETFNSRLLIDEIDDNCEAILRFLAAASPAVYYGFTISKLNILKHNISNENEFVPYLELYSAIYLNERYLLEYLKHIRSILQSMKKPAYRQILLSFFMKAVKIWIYSRPQEYLNCTNPNSSASIEADTLFDEISSSLEASSSKSSQGASRQFRSSYRFLALLLTLYPKAFDDYMNHDVKPQKKTLQKLKTFGSTNNRKQKILTSIIRTLDQQSKDTNENTSLLESLDFIVCIANIAASIYTYDTGAPIVQFSLAHSSLVTKALVPLSSSQVSPLFHNMNASEFQMVNELRLEYYSSLCVLYPNHIIPQISRILSDESVPLETLNLVTSVLKVYSSTSNTRTSHKNLLVSNIFPILKNVMTRMGRLIEINTNGTVSDGIENVSAFKKIPSGNSDSFIPTSMKSPLLESKNSSYSTLSDQSRTVSSPQTVSTPRAEKIRDSTKNLFRYYHSSNNQTSQSNSTISPEPRIELESTSTDLAKEILSNSFNIFKKYPQAFFVATASPHDSLEKKSHHLQSTAHSFLEPLHISLIDSDHKLIQAATSFIFSFMNVADISHDADSILSSYTGLAAMVGFLTKTILNHSSTNPRIKEITEVFIKLMEYRIRLNSALEGLETFELVRKYEAPFYPDVTYGIKKALLYCLCSPDYESYSLIKRGFKALGDELSFNGGRHHVESQFYNEDFFLTVRNDNTLTTGLVALQKNIRKFFLKIDAPSISVVQVWLRIYDKWFHFANSDYRSMSAAELSEFRNFAGFLAAVSGAFFWEKTSIEGFTEDIKNDISSKIDIFIYKQIGLLWQDNLVTRENAKEILAAETNPLAYPRIVKQLVPIVKEIESRASSLSERDLTVIEHIITLFKSVLVNGSQLTVYTVSIGIVESALSLARTVDSIPKLDISVLKLRIRMSTLFYQIEAQSEALVIKSGYKLRNEFLRHLYSWFDDAISYDCSCNDQKHVHLHRDNSQSRDLEYIYVDSAIESVKALALVLDSLQLEATQAMNEKELKTSRTNLFSIYFNTFLKALEIYSDTEKLSISIRHKASLVSENIIACLTNLLKSNVDVGLTFALPIGYHPNCAIRIAFLKVFISIVESYTSNQTPDSETREEDVLKLVNFFVDHPKTLLTAAASCPSSIASGLASCNIMLADNINRSTDMVCLLVRDEILSGGSYSELLRRNSFASKSLSSFGRIRGWNYLLKTLRPILAEIKNSDSDFEVEKIDINNPDAETNLNNFMHYLKRLVYVIKASIVDFPPEFRKVCKVISSAANEKYSDYRLIAVGSFIFLRFFCPAIVSPDTEKIADVPDRRTQRKFLLLARVLQNMANGSISSLKWPLLKTKAVELMELNRALFEFLDETTQLDDREEISIAPIAKIDEQDLNFFHSFLYDNWRTLRKEYLERYNDKEDIEFGMEASKMICEFLSVYGQPTISYGFEIPASITPEKNPELYDLMSSYTARDAGPISDSTFVRQGINTDGIALLVVSFAELHELREITPELILYRLFQVASKIWNQKFNIVFDCTGHDDGDHFPNRIFTLFANLAPEEMRVNCTGIYYYNISSKFYPALLEYMKNVNNFFSSGELPCFFVSAKDDPKTIASLGLSATSTRIYNDVRVKFNDVSLFQAEQKRFVPISLKIGNEFLQVAQITPFRIKMRDGIKEIYPQDIIALKDLVSINITEKTGVSNELTLNVSDGREFILASPKALEIVRLLYFTKNRASDSPSQAFFKNPINKSLDDLLGELFNVIFLGLTSSQAEIRGISYNLLAACQSRFDLNLGRRLAPFAEIHFPRDYNSFVVTISEVLAKTMPWITIEIIGSFHKVYKESATSRQRLSAILYISPWVSNLYEHVFLADRENGPDYVAEIISNFLSVSAIDMTFLSKFNSSIWSKLCLEPRITPILVNEIVLTAIDREAEGSDWKSTTALLTTTPTLELCGHVIQRLREISHIPFPDSNGTYSIAAHSNWIEITVLVQITVSLFFDSLMFAEMFLPDIFYIVTVLIDVGPMDLRVASHQLLLNVLHSFLTKPTLGLEQKKRLRSIIEHFTSHRSRILFGLNRDNNDNFPTEISKFATRMNTMESLVASLLEVIDTIGNGNDKIVWIARWNRYVIDSACRVDSVLRGRSLLLLGVLAKRGVNDNLVVKILEMVAEVTKEDHSDPKFLYFSICTIFSLSRVVEGLLPISPFFSKMFWLAVIVAHSENIALYQSGLQFILKTLTSMDTKEQFLDGDVVNTLIRARSNFGDLLDKAEAASGIVTDAKNFDQVLLYFSARGLKLPYAKVNSIETLKNLFIVRYTNEQGRIHSETGSTENKSYYCYLVFLYILVKPDDLVQVMNEADTTDEFITLDELAKLPKSLAQYVLSDTHSSNLTLLQAAFYFKWGNPNQRSMLQFLLLLRYIGKRKPALLLKVYHEIKPILRTMINSSQTASSILTEIFKLASIACIHPGYNEDVKHKENADKLLANYNLEGVKNYEFDNSDFFGNAVDCTIDFAIPQVQPVNYIKPIIQCIYTSKVDLD